MDQIKFSHLGTHWQIIVDGGKISTDLGRQITDQAKTFEKRFSRFLDESEVGQINLKAPGVFRVSAELATILEFGLQLSEKSEGYFNPAVASILSVYGYDKNLNLKPNITVPSQSGSITLTDNQVTLTGNAQLDLGGWGKGYLIDQLFDFLLAKGQKYFLIDGGGDLRSTCKQDGSPWRVALEHPFDEQMAIGVVELKNQALANSGTGKRRAGTFHHLIDFKSGKPIQSLLSSHVLAPTATVADGLATALFVSPPAVRHKLAHFYPIHYLLLDQIMNAEISPGFHLSS